MLVRGESLRAGDNTEVTTNEMEVVGALRAALAEKLGPERFERWFGSSTRLVLDGGQLAVQAPNAFFQDWLRRNFRAEIEAACHTTLGHCPLITFGVDQQAQRDRAATIASRADAPPVAAPLATLATASDAEPATLRMTPDRKASPAPARRRFAKLDSFVVGTSNRLAHTSAQLAAERPGSLSPLLIYGSTGVGKTHLLEGIWSEAMRRKAGRTVYLSAEQFTTYFLDALRGSGLPNFRRKYRGVDLLILDDVQFFAGKRATLTELLYTINTLLDEGKQLVLAADRSPAELSDLGRELTSRFEGGITCRIDPPEYETRLGIVQKLAAELDEHVPDDVQEYIAAQITSHARALSGALNRLHATSRALGKPISLAMAEDALSDLIRQASRTVRLADIEKAVCNVFGLEPKSLQSGRKAKEVSHPRMLAMWLARKHTRAALTEICSHFNRRSHATVIAAQRKVDDWMSRQKPMLLDNRVCSIDDVIRTVEERLRAG